MNNLAGATLPNRVSPSGHIHAIPSDDIHENPSYHTAELAEDGKYLQYPAFVLTFMVAIAVIFMVLFNAKGYV